MDSPPSVPRRVEIVEIAASIVDIAPPAFVRVSTATFAPIVDASKSANVWFIVTPFLAPT